MAHHVYPEILRLCPIDPLKHHPAWFSAFQHVQFGESNIALIVQGQSLGEIPQENLVFCKEKSRDNPAGKSFAQRGAKFR
jgi:hypothetical protein